MAKDFKYALADWLEGTYTLLAESPEMRAAIHDTILDLEVGSEICMDNVNTMKGLLMHFLTLHHICDRSQPELVNMLHFLRPENYDHSTSPLQKIKPKES